MTFYDVVLATPLLRLCVPAVQCAFGYFFWVANLTQITLLLVLFYPMLSPPPISNFFAAVHCLVSLFRQKIRNYGFY